MSTGRHAGERITGVPVSYLRWMLNAGHDMADKASEELERRGTVVPDMEISPHAINRASLLCWRTWHRTRPEGEGLHAWLLRVTREAIDRDERRGEDGSKLYHPAGLKLVVNPGEAWPVLVTVMPARPESG